MKRKQYNNSVNVRPSINMINTSNLDDHQTQRMHPPPGNTTFSPNNKTSRFNSSTPMDEVGMRLRIRVSYIDN